VSGDGQHVYAAGEQDGAIVQADRDGGTGALTLAARHADGFDGLDGLALVRGVALSPDDAHLYAASDGHLTAFERAPGTGALTVADQETDGVAGVDGLAGADAVVVSPDGVHVYVSAPGDDAVSGFSRDGLTGAVTFIGAWVTGLVEPRALALSPGGEHLYVASAGSDGVAVFSRDAGTGALTFIDSVLDLVTMDGARALAVSPDGVHVYVGAEHSTSFTTLRRDATSGLLTIVDAQYSNPNGVLGTNGNFSWNDLNAPRSMLVSADGTIVLVASYSEFLDGTVAVFTRDPASDRPSFVHAVYEQFVGEEILGAAGYGALAESPGGSHAYWGAGLSHALVPLTASFSGCSALPLPGCRAPGAARGSVLKIIDGSGPGSDLVSWRWKALGEATGALDLGDPTDLTHYGLCAYDESGAPTRVFSALAPAGVQRWRPIEAGPTNELIGFKMRDQYRQPDGMNVVVVKAKSPGKAALKVKGRGDHLAIPALPPGLPLRVQLQTDGAECWEATFSATGAKVNDGVRFIGTSD
jgi:6-phosphogluconolactonase (cycloisomerase 2 family)